MIYEKSVRTIADAVVADSCLYHLIGEQSAGDMRNLKPTGSSPVKDATFTDGEAWANPGYMTTGADSSAFATLPAAEAQFSLVATSLILCVRMKKATPGGTEIFVGSTKSGATPGGITLDGRADTKMRLTVFANDGTFAGISGIGGSTGITDGNEHTTVFFVPFAGPSMYCWVDGVFSNTASSANVIGKNCFGDGDMRIGSALGGNLAKAANIAVLAAYTSTKDTTDLPMAMIADYLHRNPGMPLENWHL